VAGCPGAFLGQVGRRGQLRIIGARLPPREPLLATFEEPLLATFEEPLLATFEEPLLAT
jgi:hypothetical protein